MPTTMTSKEDEYLDNGCVIIWTKRFKDKDGHWRVPIRCKCGKERVLATSTVYGKGFTGLCFECGRESIRKYIRSEPQILPNGSVIFWNDQKTGKNGRRRVRVRCGGPLCGGYERYLMIATTVSKPDFTGLCSKCGRRRGPAHQDWEGGRIITSGGYIRVWLPPDHPFYCMADSDGYCLEHRLVMARELGRHLRDYEVVHHTDRDKQNNRPENLRLYTKAQFADRILGNPEIHHALHHSVELIERRVTPPTSASADEKLQYIVEFWAQGDISSSSLYEFILALEEMGVIEITPKGIIRLPRS